MFANMDYPSTTPASAVGVATRRGSSCAALAAASVRGGAVRQQRSRAAGRDVGRAARAVAARASSTRRCRPCARRRRRGVPYWPSSAHGGAFPHQAERRHHLVLRRGRVPARRSTMRGAAACASPPSAWRSPTSPSPAPSSACRAALATRVHHPRVEGALAARPRRGLGFRRRARPLPAASCSASTRCGCATPTTTAICALGRVVTAEVMRAAFSEWRRPGSSCNGALLLVLARPVGRRGLGRAR